MPDATNIDRSAMRLTDVILGYDRQNLAEALRGIAFEIGVRHIAHVRFASDKTCDACLPTAITTYSRAWQTHYFLKSYANVDPVIAHGQKALLPFDWESLARDDPAVAAFFADALKHGVGQNGLSIPVRNGKGGQALISFSSDHERREWGGYKRRNMASLQKLSFLVDTATSRNSALPPEPIRLSRREEECLTWAARGKTEKEIAEVLDIGFGSVRM